MKKRVRRVMSLSAFITVLFISGVLIFLIIAASGMLASYQTNAVSDAVQREITSGNALRQLGVNSIEDIDENDPATGRWLDALNKNLAIHEFIPFLNKIDNVYIKIVVNDKEIFNNEKYNKTFDEFSRFYEDTESTKPIYNTVYNEIGYISVKVNPQFLMRLLVPVLGIIIIINIMALIISKILSHFLVIPIINPINQLERRVKAIAQGDHETAANTQLVLKRPLMEIESLADSTNGIMRKLNGYNVLLEEQKEALESQNEELEAQNNELTESKVQIQKQQAQLIQSEKMASVGLLTAAITHEINTPIGAINSNEQLAAMLLSELAHDPLVFENESLNSSLLQLKEVNDVNLTACGRIIEIIKSLKSFSRLDQADFQEADINDGIKSVLVLTNNLLKRRITVHEYYGDIPPVKCFPGQLNQVFMNIIVNASQAIEGEGDIYIKTFQQDRTICITISDNGTGIREENIPKIFDPGFTTKGVGVGLGLGLYISYNIIQNHHGEISVISEFGQGTEFTIKIPMDNDRT